MPARTRRTLAEMVESGFESFARCPTCGFHKEIDLPALLAKVGPDYSLWNRRCRCRRPNCIGWVRFAVGPGWQTKDYDDATEARWVEAEWQERLAREPGLRAAVAKLKR
jgi:hypothetical protein